MYINLSFNHTDWCQLENPDLNQALINWYESDGYIGQHSDNTQPLKKDSEIYSFSFGPAAKTFILEPKSESSDKYTVKLQHNSLVIMGGTCQSTHYHSVPKQHDINKRINVTFRCFK
jgi:alkylated DNA repair dioxygenase AlkB